MEDSLTKLIRHVERLSGIVQLQQQRIDSLERERAIAALIKSHPEPAKLRQSLREIQQLPGSRDGELPAPIQVQVDQTLSQLLTHLQAPQR